MKIDLLNFDKFIQIHKCKEVTNPIYFNMGNIPTDDGLFSNTIFGFPGSVERKTIFGYIDLKKHFIHPVLYKLFTKMSKNLNDLILAKRYFIVKNGELVEDSDNGKTGISYFYKIYDSLNIKNTGSYRRNTYLELLNNCTKDEIFITKFLVIPPFLRDFNASTDSNFKVNNIHGINELYSKIIRLTKSISTESSYDFMGAITESSIQELIYQVYDYFISQIKGKSGLIHKDLLGKTVDYATRSVISSPRFTGNTWNSDKNIRFGEFGIPLSQLAVLFYPFFVKYIQDFVIERENEMSHFKDKDGNQIIIKDVQEQFSENNIKKLINLYIKSVESRFHSIKIKDSNNNEYSVNLYKKDLGRNFTLTDLLFIAAKDICVDKHVYITRYPVESILNICPFRIKVLSTVETKEQRLENLYLNDYPVIFPDYPCTEELFKDTCVPNNAYLKAFGADYDGDTISVRGIFTVEANKEAEELIEKKSFVLNQNGTNARPLGNEGVQSIFTLTKD